MGLFGKSKKSKEIDKLKKINEYLIRQNADKSKEIDRLIKLSDEKDEWMSTIASEALRKGSSLGGKLLSDKKKYLRKK